MGLTLYYAPASTACRATLLTLMSLNITFNTRIVNLRAKEQMKPDFLQINPHHKLPTIDDNGFVLWESHAINAYLASKYDKNGTLCPQDPQQRALVDQRLHFDTDVLFPCFRRLVVEIVKEQKLKSVTQELTQSFHKVYEDIAPFFAQGQYITGDNLTIADYSFIVSLTVMDLFVPIKIEDFPVLADYIVNCKSAIPHYEEVNGKGLTEFKEMAIAAGFRFSKN